MGYPHYTPREREIIREAVIERAGKPVGHVFIHVLANKIRAVGVSNRTDDGVAFQFYKIRKKMHRRVTAMSRRPQGIVKHYPSYEDFKKAIIVITEYVDRRCMPLEARLQVELAEKENLIKKVRSMNEVFRAIENLKKSK